jgi:hypothetical protein
MGYLTYGASGTRIPFNDRALAHLQIVMTTKLGRGESFAFSWVEPTDTELERRTVWLHPGVSLRFRFAGNRLPRINETWLAQLSELADSDGTLHYIPEPADTAPEDAHVIQHGTPFIAAPRRLTARLSSEA